MASQQLRLSHKILSLFDKSLYWMTHQPINRRALWLLTVWACFWLWSICLINTVCTHFALSLMTKRPLLQAQNQIPETVHTKDTDVLKISEILNRNLFNAKGDIPYSETEIAQKASAEALFTAQPCSTQQVNLGVFLIGIFYSTNPNSRFAMLKTGDQIADAYKIGQFLPKITDAQISSIPSPDSVQFRYQKQKICLQLGNIAGTKNLDQKLVNQFMTTEKITLSRDIIDKCLGIGYAAALDTSQIVPAMENNSLLGFRVTFVGDQSLFARINLQSGDIITAINGKNIQTATNGFQIYDSFSHNSEVTLTVVHADTTVQKIVEIL